MTPGLMMIVFIAAYSVCAMITLGVLLEHENHSQLGESAVVAGTLLWPITVVVVIWYYLYVLGGWLARGCKPYKY